MLLHEDARKIVDELEGLPTLPVVLAELLARTEDPNTTVANITEIIGNDPSLNAKIIRLVNSAFYALPRRISSLSGAVSILGFHSIRNIVLAASIFNVFDRRRIGFDTVGFWMHSLACGVACEALSRHRRGNEEHGEFVFGLLHDIGKVVMAVHMKEAMTRVLDVTRRESVTFREAEQRLLGFTHAEIGAAVAEHWRFPESLTLAIRYHHSVEQAGAGLTDAAVIHVADILVRALQLGWCGDNAIGPVSELAWDILGLADTDVDGVLDELNSGLVAASGFIELITEQHG